ncbi:methyltransferase domain-containing protein [Nocardioides sp. 1609]|uniref:methyltransferase domain-containing protein n=1 Tax=Nocardioides sp. 1609 TaxID=2508327 RepID=UPI00107056CB|nr:methyltransferase domain-containing protein [Nocardioides sp. 1609]
MSASERRTPTAAPRTAVVWDDLEPLLAAGPLDVLDIGGGTGGSAVRIAGLGHRVTVVDPSPDALAALGRRARERGVEVAGRQGDLSDLPAAVGTDSADLVLCHGVLEVVPGPAAALGAIREVLRPGGRLSLLVAQRHAAVVARAMAGHFAQAAALLDAVEPTGGAGAPAARGRSGRRFTVEEVTGLLDGAGITVDSVHGVRVFADLVPGSLLDLEPGAGAALVDLERAVAGRSEYLPLATQLHLLAH